jgi:hypothetical protein
MPASGRGGKSPRPQYGLRHFQHRPSCCSASKSFESQQYFKWYLVLSFGTDALLGDAPLLWEHHYADVPGWWRSRFLRTILAKILASIEAVVAAAAARKTRPAPTFCKRPAWCTACRPPGIVNCSIVGWSFFFAKQKIYKSYVMKSVIWKCAVKESNCQAKLFFFAKQKIYKSYVMKSVCIWSNQSQRKEKIFRLWIK